jgi:hypothetical protein
MDALAKIALVGTSKYTGTLPASDHPAAGLFSGLQVDERERSLLLQCGAQAVYSLAGDRGVTGIEPPVPAPSETKKVAPSRLANLIQSAVLSGQTNLVLDYLRQLAARQIVLPFEILPVLLESKDTAVRRSLFPVLGERGVWLARQNPDWFSVASVRGLEAQGAEPGLKKIWEEGTIDDRCEAIASLRRLDPAAARELVAQVFAEEKPNHRVKLVASLECGLGNSDEEFLEACLNDRSAAVGQTAAGLLCLLPESALAARMRARAGAMLAIESKGISGKTTTLVCTPPQEIARDWERDGIPKRAPAAVGERAFWAETVLAAVTPGHWSSKFGLAPRELIAAIAEDAFATAVLSGWTHATARFAPHDTASAEWLVPLWEYWANAVRSLQGGERATALHRMHALFPRFPANHAFAAVESLLESAPGWQDVEAINFFSALPRPFIARFSGSFLATVRQRLKKGADQAAYRWASALTATACAIPAEAFHLALARWETAGPDDAQSWLAASIGNEISKFVATIEARQRFMKELDA